MSKYNVHYIRQLAREGKITAKKFGPVWMIDRGSLLAYLKEGEEKGDLRRGPHKT